MDTVYRQRANGRYEYWTYSDGRRYAISEKTAMSWLQKRTAKIVYVK